MKGPSVVDIARYCGVSPSTVSRALHGRGDIKAATRERILAACQELGYIPNRAATRLRGAASRTIAGVMPDNDNELFVDKLFHLRQAAVKAGWHWQLLTWHEISEVPELMMNAIGEGVRGLVVFNRVPATLRLFLQRHGCACVIYDGKDAFWPGVFLDREAGVCEAVEYLLTHGLRRILLLGADLDSVRGRGYRRAHEKLGLAPDKALVRFTPFGRDLYSYGYQEIRNVLADGLRFDGLCCVNDACAIGAIRALYEVGIRVPEDVRVVGFDDIRAGRYLVPSLSTVAQPVEEMARTAIDLLTGQLEGRQPSGSRREVTLQTRFIVRETTRFS
ncbi:MAG: LacI family transcriptional regulator [Lentisphaerae bacterium]|nr:MAG: LacI family transcriptional regulator [Lentisphaerota bacterium]